MILMVLEESQLVMKLIEKSNRGLHVQNQYLEDEVRELTAGLHEEQLMV